MKHSGTFRTTRAPEDTFDFLADPRRLLSLLPDCESIVMMDDAHFKARVRINIAQFKGHVELSMHQQQAVRPHQVEYLGSATVAGSPLEFTLGFHMVPVPGGTDVQWHGSLTLDGMLALMAGPLLDSMGRKNFDIMAARLEKELGAGTGSDPSA